MHSQLNNYLEERLKEVLTSGTWVVGTNFNKEIAEVTFEHAIKKVDGFNSIANLTFHIHYYMTGIMRVLKGGPLDISDKYSNDAPPLHSEKDWMELQERFNRDAEEFIHTIKKLDDNAILGDFDDGTYGSVIRSIDAMIEHTYYHLGQIILIKKRLKNIG